MHINQVISRLGLIDYGMGNLHSVQKAFDRLGLSLKIVRSPNDLINIEALILPGVGSFDPAMDQLKQTKLIPHLRLWAKENKPLLGICLGLQLLFESSDEGSKDGLGLIKGHVHKLPTNQGERIPHMGWSLLNQERSCPLIDKKEKNNWMYFVHSYAAIPTNKSDLAATTKFGQANVTAIVWKGKLGACQFHPEKSAKSGQRLLKRWVNWLQAGAPALT